MNHHNKNKTNNPTHDNKQINKNHQIHSSTPLFKDIHNEIDSSHPLYSTENLTISNNYNNSDNNDPTFKDLSKQSSSNKQHNPIDKNNPQIPSKTNQISNEPLTKNLQYNNSNKKTINNENDISVGPTKNHSTNTNNLNSPNNRHIENESILPTEDSDFLPPNINKTTNNEQINPTNIQFRDINFNNDDKNSQKTNPRIQSNISQLEYDSNNEEDEDNDDKNNETMTIHVDSEQLSQPYEHLRDLDNGREIYNLSGMKPLKTVVYLSIGPVLNQITSAIESLVKTVWVSKAIGKEGMSAVSSYMPFENITRAFGLTTACAGSNSISGIIATNKSDKEEGSQVIADLLRVCLIIGIIVPAVLCPLVKMAVKWLGASEKIVKIGYRYILPILICTFFTSMYLGITGFLEGEGRPILYCVITICTSIANVAFLCPLFLLGFKTGIVGAGLAQVLSHAITGIVLFILYFTGAFTLKPKFNQLFKKFSPLTKGALKACLSQGIANLTLSIPAILIRKLIGMMSLSEEDYINSVTGFHAVTQYTQIVEKIIIGFVTGYLPAASFAYSRKDFKRWLFLTLHVNWICFAWGSFCSILTFAIPRQLAEVFLKQQSYIDIAKPMIKISNSGGFFLFAQYTVGNMLRSLKMGFMAAVMGTLVHIAGMIGFSLLLYYTNKCNSVRLMYAFPLSNLFGLIAAGAFIAYPSYLFRKEWKFNEENGINNNDEINSSKPLPRIEVANLDAMN